ncbi:helix-turn-helix domain-containing protein [Levilactobacillus koreensis]|jgi:transposase|uniref:Transposase n=1 Tax=Levilactobacillus koreensis TaxID=637971 RepID=A0AAC8ZGB2_9LACO|nr:helix-turn-helix domain-containing protein [Levilactobacillus koreensis]AKP64393.1 transposase [Levilactobacillus koreensis]AKP64658.1 transposase [Levilactobacillus koreensis]AKP64699.1 transposase [Levilactobacillus koreensis]AKP64711.1 transposase [Levilactobacillus koreensis]
MPRSRFSAIEKLALINEFKVSGLSSTAFGKANGLGKHTVAQWLDRYQRDGLDGLKEAKKNHHYSSALKLQVVYAFLNGEGSAQKLAMKYGLRSFSQVMTWVSKYNKDKTVTASPSRKLVPKMSRKTTWEERIEVVEYITNHKHSYSEAAEHYQVSYQQARSWVLKAKEGGYETLRDNRGHRKTPEKLTDLDKANLRIRQLEGQVADMKLLEEFVKKYQELQRKG